MPVRGRRESLAQFKAFAADRKLVTGRQWIVVQIEIDLYQCFRRKGMRAETRIAGGCQLAESERRRDSEAGVDKQDELSIFKVERMFDLQLEVGQAFDLRQPECLDAFDAQRAERVVAP